ncbi:hypothetical protein PG995_006495 [Apiospora arundinis]
MAISEQQYEPSEWSITTDDPILTPEPSEVGGPCHESDWRKSLGSTSTTAASVVHDLPQKVWDETNPWPGNAYMIIEKATGRALTLRNGELLLVELGSASQKVAQTATTVEAQCVLMRLAFKIGKCSWLDQFGGGYQLLMPHYWHTLQVIALYNGGKHLTRRMHGGIVWEFRRAQT